MSFPERPPAMVDPTLLLPGLSSVAGKEIVARFDGGQLSSDGGLLMLRAIEQRLKVAERLAACIDDPRDPVSTVQTIADIIRFRLLMIAAGYDPTSAPVLKTCFSIKALSGANWFRHHRVGGSRLGFL